MTKHEEIKPADHAPVGEVLAAAAKAMAAVQKIGKSERNKHDGYNFASIDDFLAMVNPICAEAGLVFLVQELAIEDFTRKSQNGESAWMRIQWAISVYHTSGQCLPPVTRTVEVLRNGAQAYGSAQSYALKQFLRSFLLIATGDKDDADHQTTDGGAIVGAPPRESPSSPSPDAIESAKSDIEDADTLDKLKSVWGSLAKAVQSSPAAVKAKNDRKAAIERQAEDEQKSSFVDDEIPY